MKVGSARDEEIELTHLGRQGPAGLGIAEVRTMQGRGAPRRLHRRRGLPRPLVGRVVMDRHLPSITAEGLGDGATHPSPRPGHQRPLAREIPHGPKVAACR